MHGETGIPEGGDGMRRMELREDFEHLGYRYVTRGCAVTRDSAGVTVTGAEHLHVKGAFVGEEPKVQSWRVGTERPGGYWFVGVGGTCRYQHDQHGQSVWSRG